MSKKNQSAESAGRDIMDWMNILERAGWTFLEAFLVALPTTISADMDGAAWKAMLLSAVCAGLSAVKSFVIELLKNKTA